MRCGWVTCQEQLQRPSETVYGAVLWVETPSQRVFGASGMGHFRENDHETQCNLPQNGLWGKFMDMITSMDFLGRP